MHKKELPTPSLPNSASKPSPGKEEIIAMMEDFDTSQSVTVKEFCEIHEIDADTFRKWHNIYENRNNHNGSSGFVALEVQLPQEERLDAPMLFAEIHGIRLYREVSAEYLKALLS